MTDTSQTLSPPWWMSKTIWTQAIAAALVVVNALGAKYGFQIDGSKWSDTLAGDLVDIATILTLVYAGYRHQLSKKATAVTIPVPVTVEATKPTTVVLTPQPTPPLKTD
jgi:hypothetical protein